MLVDLVFNRARSIVAADSTSYKAVYEPEVRLYILPPFDNGYWGRIMRLNRESAMPRIACTLSLGSEEPPPLLQARSASLRCGSIIPSKIFALTARFRNLTDDKYC
jgi:hypothetical protein